MDEYISWLKEAGVDLPDHRLERLANKIARQLEVRVGDLITDQLTDEQLDEFEAVVREAQQKQYKWLEENYPGYSSIVAQEAERLRNELKGAKDAAILIKRWH